MHRFRAQENGLNPGFHEAGFHQHYSILSTFLAAVSPLPCIARRWGLLLYLLTTCIDLA
jgi:hypothetical protein